MFNRLILSLTPGLTSGTTLGSAFASTFALTLGLSPKFSAVTHRNLKCTLLFIVLSVLPTLCYQAYAQNEQLEQLRIWHSPDSTRIVFDVSASTEYKTFLLENPKRLVVDLDQLNLSVELPAVKNDNQHLSQIRSGRPKANVLRVVFDLKKDIKLESFVLTPNELYGHRLVIDLINQKSPTTASSSIDKNGAKGSALVPKDADVSVPNDDQMQAAKEASEPIAVATTAAPSGPFTVAIDAGHGGDDPGALGHRGTKEKQLTLAIAKKLYDKINKNKDMKAVLVRSGDYFIELKGRRRKARTLGADAFISIHADAFIKKSARGMSVFALSQRGATSAMASALAAKENASDLIGGVSLANKDEVLQKVLVDLSMTNTISESVNLGGRVLAELGKIGKLHSKRVEQANFSVLRSPDLPSILVETGFITNPDEERKLRTSRYQNQIASGIYQALKEYYQQTPYASRSRYASPDIASSSKRSTSNSGAKSSSKSSSKTIYGRHQVVKGDSLSTIAKRYGISLRELKRLNKIKHNTAMLGVRLKVPIGKENVRSSLKTSSKTSSKAAKKGSLTYVVKNGDSLSRLSAKYNVTINAIKRANGLTRNTLRKGERLKIPGVSVSKKPVKHKVVRGDTLSEIAQKYGSSIAKIKQANNLKSLNVRLGQVLTIPN